MPPHQRMWVLQLDCLGFSPSSFCRFGMLRTFDVLTIMPSTLEKLMIFFYSNEIFLEVLAKLGAENEESGSKSYSPKLSNLEFIQK